MHGKVEEIMSTQNGGMVVACFPFASLKHAAAGLDELLFPTMFGPSQ
jgi:hypothetical protein